MKRLTVKQLADLSGVSVRTLHYYDAIGLLAPSYIGENNYRYYEGEQILRLQQILFYKDMGMSLREIGKIINDKNFDKIKALKNHRQRIETKLNRYQQLIQTIDATINELGNKKMKKIENPFKGFSPEKQDEYEKQLVENYGEQAQSKIDQANENLSKMSEQKLQLIKNEGHEINLILVKLIEQGKEPNSKQVQELIARHHAWVSNFWTPDKDAYIGLGQNYCNHQDFRKFYDKYDERLVEFLAKSMNIFAQENLDRA